MIALQTIGIYLGVINLITFLAYGIDKLKAKNNRWRTPEATLIFLAILGGSIGAWMGMTVFRHKTKHKKFTWGIPTILILQVAMASLFILSGCKSTSKTENRTELVGGFTNPREITADELELFKSVTSGTAYENYVPESVSTQIVAGVNFRYLCSNGKSITIHKPLPHQGEPRILKVE